MKKIIFVGGYLFLFLGVLLSNFCLASDNFVVVDKIDGFKLEIGEVLPQSFFDTSKSSEMLKTGSEQSLPGYNIKSKGIKYKIGVDESKIIVFIYSDDTRCVTPEKIKPGMKFMDALKIANESPNSSVIVEKGWISFMSYKSGWNAAILLNEKDQWSIFDNVAFVFKRKQ